MRRLTAALTSLLLALAVCVPAMAAVEYGAFYDETGELGSVELTYLGEEKLPQLTEMLGVDLRVDVFTDEDVEEGSTVSDIAVYVYGNSGYGWGEEKEGVSLTLLMETLPDGSYALAESGWCVYAFLSESRGSSQELSNTVYEAVEPYMAERAWNGEDMMMSATALTQAVDAMAEAASDYILENCPLDSSDEKTEVQTSEKTGADMNYIFDLCDRLSSEEWAELEARAADISQRHGCGVYTAFVDDFTEYGSGDVYQTTYQIYHANALGMGEGRDGIIILLSMDDRDYAMFVYGDRAEDAFNKYGQEQLENAFLSYFSNNDWYNGVSHYLDTCDEYLTLAEEGNPVRKNTLPMYLIVVAGSCVISIFICLMLKWKMQTVHKKVEANEYVAAGGLRLTEKHDRYTHTTETRRKIHDDSDSGGSTSSSSGGGGSGRSGKF